MRKLMALPEGSWVRFTTAFAEEALCCPTRATLLTGQYAFKHGIINNSVAEQFNDTNTLAVWLDAAGYRTALYGKYLNGYPWTKGAGYVPPGWDAFKSPGSTIGGTDAHTDLAVNFIDSSQSPVFLYLAYRDPHRTAKVERRYRGASVYVPPIRANVNEADVSDKPAWIRSNPLLTQSQLGAERTEQTQAQRALLAVDDGVQRVVDALKAKGELDNTLLIFLSDNGYSWGSHRHVGQELRLRGVRPHPDADPLPRCRQQHRSPLRLDRRHQPYDSGRGHGDAGLASRRPRLDALDHGKRAHVGG